MGWPVLSPVGGERVEHRGLHAVALCVSVEQAGTNGQSKWLPPAGLDLTLRKP